MLYSIQIEPLLWKNDSEDYNFMISKKGSTDDSAIDLKESLVISSTESVM